MIGAWSVRSRVVCRVCGLARAAAVGGAEDGAEDGLEAGEVGGDDADVAFGDDPDGEVARVP